MKALPPTFRVKRVDREIAELLRQGMEEKKIARKLGIPYKAVKKKVEKLRKLGIVS